MMIDLYRMKLPWRKIDAHYFLNLMRYTALLFYIDKCICKLFYICLLAFDREKKDNCI